MDWKKQGCGVHQAPFLEVLKIMPDIAPILQTFPDDHSQYTWDVKVHMLMPGQYPCIPNWHSDFVPRVNGIQRYDLVRPELPLYCWVSGAPLTQFKHGYLTPKTWHRFSQLDEHRGIAASDFVWRGFIRATHREIQPPKESNWERRHCQVYLNAESYQW